MLGIVLTISLLAVFAAVVLYRADFAVVILLFSLGILASTPFLYASAKSLFLIYPALLATWVVCRRWNVSRPAFAALATLSVAAAWGLALALFFPRWKETQRLASEYPVVRMEERLAYERRKISKSESGNSRGAAIPSDEAVAEASGVHYHWDDKRGSALASLERTHDSYVDAFTEQEAFGFIRMIHLPPREEYVRLPEPEPIALDMPPPESASAGVSEAAQPVSNPEPFDKYHSDRALDFVNPLGFGLALDGEWRIFGRVGANQIRGFQPHSFRQAPQGSPAGDDWRLTKLELVSLLKHDPPAAYLSDHLPRMQELGTDDSPSRPLDDFESAALESISNGRTIVAEETRNRIRMLGALRAGERCTQCHAVEPGHLLGAFTYEFRRKTPLPPAKEQPQEAAKPVI